LLDYLRSLQERRPGKPLSELVQQHEPDIAILVLQHVQRLAERAAAQ
jgi:hypothetical protein